MPPVPFPIHEIDHARAVLARCACTPYRALVLHWPARPLRLVVLIAVEVLAIVMLFVIVATVVIPRAAPPPSPPTPSVPVEALRDCPRQLPGCR